MTSLALLVIGALMRPLYWLTVALALAAIALVAARLDRANPRKMLQQIVPYVVLPAALTIGWAVRQAVLSGYPLYPSTVLGLPVDWRVPAATVDSANRWIASWARHPGIAPDHVLDSWQWLTAWWLPTHSHDFNVMIPLALLILALAPLTLRRAVRRRAPANETMAMLTVLVPATATIVAWFFIAPDPRFALAPIWLVPLVIAAWTMPTGPTGDFSEETITVAFLVAVVAFFSGRVDARVIPASALAIAAATFLASLLYRAHLAVRMARVIVLATLLGSLGVFSTRGVFTEVYGDEHGTFGAPQEPTPVVVSFRTNSGLLLKRPATGEQCWRVLLCTPYPDRRLRLRGTTFSHGLRIDAVKTSGYRK
jgi:hypothetical protein